MSLNPLRRNGSLEMPRPPSIPTATMPTPARASAVVAAPLHEDVGRAMQNVIDLQNEVARLTKQSDSWERNALLADDTVTQLKSEIAAMRALHRSEIDHLSERLAHFERRDTIIQTKLQIGAKHFLDCIDPTTEQKAAPPRVNLEALEAEIEKQNEAMPAVVTAGPRDGQEPLAPFAPRGTPEISG